MKFCIYGAGAIGCYIGAKLFLQGHDVSLVARGPHLEALQQYGLRLIEPGHQTGVSQTTCLPIPSYGDAEKPGPQDVVIITLKAHAVQDNIEKIKLLLGPDTSVVTAQNGILWWYFYKLQGPWQDYSLKSTDPDRKIWNGIGPERVIGCVVYPSCEVIEPGVVRHLHGNRLMIGELDGSKTPRILSLNRAFTGAGFKAPIRRNIRDDIWLKLWGNCTFNPLSVLTMATLEQLASAPEAYKLIYQIMTEAASVAAQLGVTFNIDIETRVKWARDVGAFKSSMLQDLEKGRGMEIDALVTAIVELGRLVNIPTPTLDVILHLIKLRAQVAGLY